MAEKMKMSHNVAGVTLLALGNGAPGRVWIAKINYLPVTADFCLQISFHLWLELDKEEQSWRMENFLGQAFSVQP